MVGVCMAEMMYGGDDVWWGMSGGDDVCGCVWWEYVWRR